jgi:ribonuclease P/MRP protein subunit RPP40
MVAIDISKAFDTVDHTLLLRQISESNLEHNVVRWLVTYLRGRTASCIYQSAKSPLMLIHSGVPQGGVLSLPLYNHFTSNFSEEADLTESYADDFEVAESDPDIVTLSTALTDDLVHVSKWAAAKNLKIAPTKSSVTLFTPDRHQSHAHPQVYLDEELILLCRNPKILGVTFDPPSPSVNTSRPSFSMLLVDYRS